MIYIDTSVALAELFTERRRPPVEFWDQLLVSSRLLEFEIWTRVNAYGDLQISSGAENLIGTIELLEVSPTIIGRIHSPFPMPLRTLDAIHVATLHYLQTGGVVRLASYDERMNRVAKALGIPLCDLL